MKTTLWRLYFENVSFTGKLPGRSIQNRTSRLNPPQTADLTLFIKHDIRNPPRPSAHWARSGAHPVRSWLLKPQTPAPKMSLRAHWTRPLFFRKFHKNKPKILKFQKSLTNFGKSLGLSKCRGSLQNWTSRFRAGSRTECCFWTFLNNFNECWFTP